MIVKRPSKKSNSLRRQHTHGLDRLNTWTATCQLLSDWAIEPDSGTWNESPRSFRLALYFVAHGCGWRGLASFHWRRHRRSASVLDKISEGVLDASRVLKESNFNSRKKWHPSFLPPLGQKRISPNSSQLWGSGGVKPKNHLGHFSKTKKRWGRSDDEPLFLEGHLMLFLYL